MKRKNTEKNESEVVKIH